MTVRAVASPHVVAHARAIAEYLADLLGELEVALESGDRSGADALAAAFVGIERRADVRAALAVETNRGGWRGPQWSRLEARWRELRRRCAFPGEPAIRSATAELSAVPPPLFPTDHRRDECRSEASDTD